MINEYGYEYYSRKGLYIVSNQKAINIINALLNFYHGYTEHKLLIEISKQNLDFNLSFLHEPQYNKLPLTYDLIELIRADIDKTVLRLAEKRKIRKSDFVLYEGYYMIKQDKIKRYLNELKIDTKMP